MPLIYKGTLLRAKLVTLIRDLGLPISIAGVMLVERRPWSLIGGRLGDQIRENGGCQG